MGVLAVFAMMWTVGGMIYNIAHDNVGWAIAWLVGLVVELCMLAASIGGGNSRP